MSRYASFSGTVTFATNYVFRGESETADGDIPAIQSSITWPHERGWYVGIFGSTNKFKSTPAISAVIVPYLGKSGKMGESKFNYNIFVFHYTYPEAGELDYTELWIKINRDFNPVNLAFEVTPTLNDWFGVDGWKHWSIGVSLKRYGLTFDLRYHGTDIDSTHRVYGSSQGLYKLNTRTVLSISKSL